MSERNYTRATAIVPSDATDLTDIPDAILVTGTGNVVGDFPNGGTNITVGTGVAAGVVIPVSLARVRAATTATVVGLHWR